MKGLIPKALEVSRAFVVKHDSDILAGVAIGCMVATPILSAQATSKSVKELQEAGLEEAPLIEKAKHVGKNYILTGSVAITGIVSVGGVRVIDAKKLKGALTELELARTAMRVYQEKVREHIGQSKERGVRHDIHEDEIRANPPSEKLLIRCGAENGESLFYDPNTGQYFVSTYEKVKRAAITINNRLRGGEDWIELSEFLEEAGGGEAPATFQMGFQSQADMQDVIDVRYLCDPHTGDYMGHECTIVYLNYDLIDQRYYI